MDWKRKLIGHRCAGCVGGALAALLGLVLWATPFGQTLLYLSYDLPFLFGSQAPFTNTVLIYMDEDSRDRLGQSYKDWDRTWHAHVVDHLTRDQAALVVFDIYLTDPGRPAANAALARAIRANTHVVLAADVTTDVVGVVRRTRALLPLDEFVAAARSWGLHTMLPSAGSTVRQHFPSSETHPNLAWAAARAAGAAVAQSPPDPNTERWINYYSPGPLLPELKYCEVTNQPPGAFRDKFVFIGGKPKPDYQAEQTDEFLTPRRLWGGSRSPGLEIHALAFLNLLREDWLRRTARFVEMAILLGSGLLAGLVLARFRPVPAVGVAALGALGVTALAVVWFWQKHIWFPWTLIVAIQIPCALASSALAFTRRLQKSLISTPVPARALVAAGSHAATLEVEPRGKLADHSQPQPPSGLEAPTSLAPSAIPNYTLRRRMGVGAYGQVWLAQDIIGTYHAIKIIERATFKDDRPYEREFMGMKRFTPISRDHPGLVQVLHVGRNDQAQYFYYVMEAADDTETGRAIDPDRYAPKDLAKLLQQHGRLSVRECLRLCLPLASALAYLHDRQLIHRDIKPSNIIFVNGAPKIADIGLITDVRRDPGESTIIGTTGFMPARGHGRPSADVYAFGVLIYLMSIGSLEQFPDLPSTLAARPDEEDLLALNQIIRKCSYEDPDARYPCGQGLCEALRMLQTRLEESGRR